MRTSATLTVLALLLLAPGAARAGELEDELIAEVRAGRSGSIARLVASGADVDAVHSWTRTRRPGIFESIVGGVVSAVVAPIAIISGNRPPGLPRARTTTYYETALTGAIARHSGRTRRRLVNALLEAGANPDLGPEEGDTPLLRATQLDRSDRALTLSLLEAGADPDLGAPLARLVGGGTQWLQQAELLLTHGADPDRENALCLAAAADDTPTARLLLEHGARARSDEGCPGGPLAVAAAGDALALGRVLLEHGVTADGEGDTRPLVVALDAGHEAWLELLLTAGADPSLASRGRAPLIAAVEQQQLNVLPILVSAGADPAVMKDERSALELAIEADWLEGGQWLIEHGGYVAPGPLALALGRPDRAHWQDPLEAALPEDLVAALGSPEVEELALTHDPAALRHALAAVSGPTLVGWQRTLPADWGAMLRLPPETLAETGALSREGLQRGFEVLGTARMVAQLGRAGGARVGGLLAAHWLHPNQRLTVLGTRLRGSKRDALRTLRRGRMRMRRSRTGDTLRFAFAPRRAEGGGEVVFLGRRYLTALRLDRGSAEALRAGGVEEPLADLLAMDRDSAWLALGARPLRTTDVGEGRVVDRWRVGAVDFLEVESDAAGQVVGAAVGELEMLD